MVSLRIRRARRGPGHGGGRAGLPFDATGLVSGAMVGTSVMTALMETAQARRLTRMSLPYILGTMMSDRRSLIRVYGSLFHFVNGMLFASGYALVFERLKRSGPLTGAAVGGLHGMAALVAILPIVQDVHPRMGQEDEGPDPTPMLQPPGFMALNYGIQTPAVTMVAHLVYGGIVGTMYRLDGIRPGQLR
jgi:hypothetical protein